MGSNEIQYELTRVTRHKRAPRLFTLNIFDATLTWPRGRKDYRTLPLVNLNALRFGVVASSYRHQFNISDEFKSRWISVIYWRDGKLKGLHLIAGSTNEAKSFVRDIRTLWHSVKNKEQYGYGLNDSDDLKELESPASNIVNPIKNVDLDKVVKLLNDANVCIDDQQLISLFNSCCKDSSDLLDFDQFKLFVEKLKRRDEFDIILDSILANADASGFHCDSNDTTFDKNSKIVGINLNQFSWFLTNIQKETSLSKEDIAQCFEKFSKGKSIMSAQDLGNYFISSHNYSLHTTMNYDYPINDYFIASSHNTYLLGKQFVGESSIEGYIKALERGCKCLEIDIWDGENNRPVVTHGHTLTNSIDFEDVIEIIRDYAFLLSPWPLIISLEIKCSLETQRNVISVLEKVLGDMLITEPINDSQKLPTPNEMKNKILLKVKQSKMISDDKLVKSSTSASASTAMSSIGITNTSNSSTDTELTPSKSGTSSPSSSPLTKNTVIKNIIPRRKITPILPSLTAMAPYLVGVKFRNFSLPESKTFNHIFSFSDKTLNSMKSNIEKYMSILKHNRRYMMRIYPNIMRFKSDNFNPLDVWEMGGQMAATNWQVWDIYQELTQGLFNGSKGGYYLKPQCQRIDDEKEEIEKLKLLKSLTFNKPRKFKIKIISGQQLIRSPGLNPFIEIEIWNVKFNSLIDNNKAYNDTHKKTTNYDTIPIPNENKNLMKEQSFFPSGSISVKIPPASTTMVTCNEPSAIFTTNTVNQNGFNPQWDVGASFEYFTNENQLGFIRVVVKGERRKYATSIKGSMSLPVNENSESADDSVKGISAHKSLSATSMLRRGGSTSSDGGNSQSIKNPFNSPKKEVIGSWCARLKDLKPGYRTLRLLDGKGEELLYSGLFVWISHE